MSAVTRQSWASSLLGALGDPTTATNVQIIVGWEVAEGGAGPQFGVPHNITNYNPLNTSLKMPGSADTPGNPTAPIQSYVSWKQGMQATVKTLNNGDYGPILTMLTSGKATPSQAAKAISGTPWNPGGYSNLVSDITQQSVSASDTGATVTYQGTGGTAGSGGTGVTPNTASSSLFYVSDVSNPDQDYWTALNSAAQQAYWYFFSDGEYLYVADGYEIIQQPPAANIHRRSPNLLHADFCWDNTAFGYASTHAKHAKAQRKTSLAHVTSPVMGTVHWICDIDAIRAGDIVQLFDYGQAIDGPWLVGNCYRSIFLPYSELTLVPPIQPQPVAPIPTLTGAAASAPGSGTVMAAMISAAATINNDKVPYVYGGGRPAAGTPSIGSPGGTGYNGTRVGFDGPGAIAAVLHAGGLWGSAFNGNGAHIIQSMTQNNLILPGVGKGTPECTLYDSGHVIFMSLNGDYWGTSDVGGTPTHKGGGGGAWLSVGSVATYKAYHVPKALLEQVPTPGSSASSGATLPPSGVINPIAGFTIGRQDMGVDASATTGAAIVAPAACTLVGYQATWFGVEPLLLFKFDSALPGAASQYWYVAEQITPTTITIPTHFNQGDTVATFAATGTGIEIGWGDPTTPGLTLAQLPGRGTGWEANPPAGKSTPDGSSFQTFFGIS